MKKALPNSGVVVSDQDSELPEGWTLPTLGTFLTVSYGKGLAEELRKHGDVQVYGSNGVVGEHNKSFTSGSTIVIGRKGTVGAVHFSDQPCWPIDTTYFIEEFHGLDPLFLSYGLQILGLSELDTSTAIPGLNRDDLYAQPLPLAPFAEQQRIVARVRELSKRVNSSRTSLASVLKLLKAFRRSVLAAACSGRLTEDWRSRHPDFELPTHEPAPVDWPGLPEGWSVAALKSICSEVVDCPHSTPKWADSGQICIRTTNFLPGCLNLADVRYVSESTYAERIGRLEPQGGDVLYSREGGILGIACQIPPKVRLCLGQRMMLMRSDPQKLSSTFLMHVLNSPFINAQVKDLTSGSASPHLNVGEIKQFPVPLPSVREQHEIVRCVDALFKLADKIEERVAAATKRADKLTQSILAKAFRGELVLTEAELARKEERDYEPASALLARIRAERAKVATRPPHIVKRRAATGKRVNA